MKRLIVVVVSLFVFSITAQAQMGGMMGGMKGEMKSGGMMMGEGGKGGAMICPQK